MGIDSTSILSVSRCKYKYESYVSNHCHNFYHFLYITGGKGKLIINGIDHVARENDAYLIPPGVYHEFSSNSENPLCTLDVKFMLNDTYLEKYVSKLPMLIHNTNIERRLILEALLQEAISKRPFYKEMITNNFVEFLLHLMRVHSYLWDESEVKQETNESNFIIGKTEYSDEHLDSILRYIHNNYEKKITLSNLSQIFAINQAHLCRVFSKKYGVSPIQHLNNWRILKAKELLAYTEMSITDISEKVGFQSMHYLSRCFTNKEKLSPLHYRHKMKESIYLTVEEKFEIIDAKVVTQ